MLSEIAQESRTVVVEGSRVAVVVEPWEVAMAVEAASRLVESIPHRTVPELADELLSRALHERTFRERRNLNHWPQHAPQYLNRLVRSLANQEAWRRRRNEAFFRSDYEKACAVARAQLPSREDVEDVVGEAFLRLAANRTTPRNFYRTLKQLIVDRQRKSAVERRLFVSQEDLREGDRSRRDAPRASGYARQADVRDPQEVLVDRRNRVARPLMVAQAKKRPNWRNVRRRRWAQPLQATRAETAPQTHM